VVEEEEQDFMEPGIPMEIEEGPKSGNLMKE
jgi:hypothetical protein